MMVICPDCGSEVPKEKFCKNCGAFIANIEDTPAEKTDDVVVEEPSSEVLDVSVVEPAEVVSEPVGKSPEIHDKKSKYCFNCGKELPSDFHFCPNCGQDQTTKKISPEKVTGEKSTLLAVILSVVLPGLGQIYLGLDSKGAILLIAYIISAFLILFFIGILLVIIIWIWALVDTIISVNAINRGEKVTDKLF